MFNQDEKEHEPTHLELTMRVRAARNYMRMVRDIGTFSRRKKSAGVQNELDRAKEEIESKQLKQKRLEERRRQHELKNESKLIKRLRRLQEVRVNIAVTNIQRVVRGR